MDAIYEKIRHTTGAKVRSKTANLDSLTIAQLVVLINVFLTNEPSKISTLKGFIRRRTVGKNVNIDKDFLKEAIQNFNGSQQYVTVPVFEGLDSLISPDMLNKDAFNFLTSNDRELKKKSDTALKYIVTKLNEEESKNQDNFQPSLLQQKLELREGSNASASASAGAGAGAGGLKVTILPKKSIEVQTSAIPPADGLPVSRLVPGATGRATSRKNQPQGKKEMNK